MEEGKIQIKSMKFRKEIIKKIEVTPVFFYFSSSYLLLSPPKE
jgi:hypothetical protein